MMRQRRMTQAGPIPTWASNSRCSVRTLTSPASASWSTRQTERSVSASEAMFGHTPSFRYLLPRSACHQILQGLAEHIHSPFETASGDDLRHSLRGGHAGKRPPQIQLAISDPAGRPIEYCAQATDRGLGRNRPTRGCQPTFAHAGQRPVDPTTGRTQGQAGIVDGADTDMPAGMVQHLLDVHHSLG